MPCRCSEDVLKSTLAIIMGGGRGARLFPLTHRRSKPAVPLAGKYRLVDIPISNCINSNIRHIYVLTQFNTKSLHTHITNTYKFDSFASDFVHILAAQQTPGHEEWYQGTADAVRRNIDYFLVNDYQYFLILSGDQLYRMDYSKMLQEHITNGASVTIATTPVTRESARAYGIMDTDDQGLITSFCEKPGHNEALLDTLCIPTPLLEKCGIPADKERFLASMGIYIFNRNVLRRCLDNNLADFGGDIIPQAIKDFPVFSYVFQDYWEDIGTIRSFYEANISLTKIIPSFNFFDPENTIYSRARFLPASKINKATIEQALVSDGCIISNAHIRNSIIGLRSVIENGCEISDSVIMGSDFYNKVDVDKNGDTRRTPIRIGAGTRIHRTIVDKNTNIGSGVIIDPTGITEDCDLQYCFIRDGIAIVPKDITIPDGVNVTARK